MSRRPSAAPAEKTLSTWWTGSLRYKQIDRIRQDAILTCTQAIAALKSVFPRGRIGIVSGAGSLPRAVNGSNRAHHTAHDDCALFKHSAWLPSGQERLSVIVPVDAFPPEMWEQDDLKNEIIDTLTGVAISGALVGITLDLAIADIVHAHDASHLIRIPLLLVTGPELTKQLGRKQPSSTRGSTALSAQGLYRRSAILFSAVEAMAFGRIIRQRMKVLPAGAAEYVEKCLAGVASQRPSAIYDDAFVETVEWEFRDVYNDIIDGRKTVEFVESDPLMSEIAKALRKSSRSPAHLSHLIKPTKVVGVEEFARAVANNMMAALDKADLTQPIPASSNCRELFEMAVNKAIGDGKTITMVIDVIPSKPQSEPEPQPLPEDEPENEPEQEDSEDGEEQTLPDNDQDEDQGDEDGEDPEDSGQDDSESENDDDEDSSDGSEDEQDDDEQGEGDAATDDESPGDDEQGDDSEGADAGGEGEDRTGGSEAVSLSDAAKKAASQLFARKCNYSPEQVNDEVPDTTFAPDLVSSGFTFMLIPEGVDGDSQIAHFKQTSDSRVRRDMKGYKTVLQVLNSNLSRFDNGEDWQEYGGEKSGRLSDPVRASYRPDAFSQSELIECEHRRLTIIVDLSGSMDSGSSKQPYIPQAEFAQAMMDLKKPGLDVQIVTIGVAGHPTYNGAKASELGLRSLSSIGRTPQVANALVLTDPDDSDAVLCHAIGGTPTGPAIVTAIGAITHSYVEGRSESVLILTDGHSDAWHSTHAAMTELYKRVPGVKVGVVAINLAKGALSTDFPDNIVPPQCKFSVQTDPKNPVKGALEFAKVANWILG